MLIGALAAPVIVFLRRGLPESPRWLAKHGRLAEADRVLKVIEAKVAAEYRKPLPAPGPDEPVAPASGFMDLWVPGVRGRVILMSVFNIFQTIGFYGFSNWVPSLLVKQGITVSTSLGYTTVIALAAPVGPLIGFFLGDKFERKWIIVAAAFVILVCGLVFGQAREAAPIIAMGVMLTLGNNIMSYSFHAYQQELFPTGIRARAAGFVYSWSRLSVIFNSFVIAFVLDAFGAPGVFVFIAAAMAIVMATIGISDRARPTSRWRRSRIDGGGATARYWRSAWSTFCEARPFTGMPALPSKVGDRLFGLVADRAVRLADVVAAPGEQRLQLPPPGARQPGVVGRPGRDDALAAGEPVGQDARGQRVRILRRYRNRPRRSCASPGRRGRRSPRAGGVQLRPR